MDNIVVDRKALMDLVKLAEEMSDRVESIELMNNKEFMDSYKKSKEQIKKREFADWDAQ